MANFFFDKFYLFFQGILVFQTIFLFFLYAITKKSDLLFYAGYLFLTSAYFFLNAPHTFFNLTDEVVFNSTLYTYFNIPLIICTQLLYLIFLRTFFSAIYQHRSVQVFYKIIIFSIPLLIIIFYFLRLLHQPTQSIFYIANFLGALLTIWLLIVIARKKFVASRWILSGMVINLIGNGLTILMIVLERNGIKNILTYDYPLVFMRLGILADMFFYLIAILKKWHVQEKQLAVSEIEKELTIAKMRNQIGSELHDDIGAELSGINLYSHLANQQALSGNIDEAKSSLSVIQESTTKIIDRLKEIVWNVTPHENEPVNLIEKIKLYTRYISKPSNIIIQFKYDTEFEQKIISDDIAQNLFLICKEAITNAVKYSACNKIEINLNKYEQKITLSIKDNGKGFDTKETHYGNGLKNIASRIKSMNGSCIIASTIGKGTVINIAIPK